VATTDKITVNLSAQATHVYTAAADLHRHITLPKPQSVKVSGDRVIEDISLQPMDQLVRIYLGDAMEANGINRGIASEHGVRLGSLEREHVPERMAARFTWHCSCVGTGAKPPKDCVVCNGVQTVRFEISDEQLVRHKLGPRTYGKPSKKPKKAKPKVLAQVREPIRPKARV